MVGKRVGSPQKPHLHINYKVTSNTPKSLETRLRGAAGNKAGQPQNR